MYPAQNVGVGSQQSVSGKFGGGKCAFGLDVDDCALVLIDHQTGLFNLVRDMDVADLRNNVLALAKAGSLSRIPVILTANDEEGPHGQLLPEFEREIPNALFVPRKGEINAWELPEFVKTIEQTGKKTLIMAGTLANVCLAFPAISASCCGYKVFAVIDASGSSSKVGRELTLHRLTSSGVTVIDTIAVIAQLMKNHCRKDKNEWWAVMSEVLPRYKLLIDAFYKTEYPTTSSKGLQGKNFPTERLSEQTTDMPRYKDSRFGQEYGKTQDIGIKQGQQWR